MPLLFYRRFRVSVAGKASAPGIGEQPRPKADQGPFRIAQIHIEAHFAGRKSLL
jgi:hypothetical protein